MAVAVYRQPIDCVTAFILSIRVSLVMPHMHRIVHRLRKAAGDRLRDSKQAIEQSRTEKRVMNKVVPYAIDVRIHHQRVDQP